MRQLYAKHNIHLYKKIRCNSVTNALLEYLRGHYGSRKAPEDSLVDQLKKISVKTGDVNCLLDLNGSIKKIENLYAYDNKGLMDSINFIISKLSKQNNYINMMECWRAC